MAKLIMVSLYDKKAQTYGNINTYQNSMVALRDLSTAVQNENVMLSKYPEDFELKIIGEFDNHTGIITMIEPQTIGKATDYIEKKD